MSSYDVYRGGDGPPLLLLHGMNATWRIWNPVVPGLQQAHRVLAPTLAGHRGGPPLVAGAHGIGPLADALEKFLDNEGLDRVHITGNSLGGWLALELAQRGRAHSVVAFSPAGAFAELRDFKRLARLMKLARRSADWPSTQRLLTRPGARRAFLRSAFEHGDRIPAEVAVEMLADTQACLLLDGLLRHIRTHGPIRSLTIGAEVPVRLAWPEHDRTIPFERYGRPYQALLAQAELIRLSGVGHVPMYDDPTLVVRTVLEVTASDLVTD